MESILTTLRENTIRNWRQFANKMEALLQADWLNPRTIQSFHDASQPPECIFREWSSKQSYTVGNLIKILNSLGHEILISEINADPKLAKLKHEDLTINFPEFSFEEISWIDDCYSDLLNVQEYASLFQYDMPPNEIEDDTIMFMNIRKEAIQFPESYVPKLSQNSGRIRLSGFTNAIKPEIDNILDHTPKLPNTVTSLLTDSFNPPWTYRIVTDYNKINPQSRSTKDTKSEVLKSAMSKIRRDRVKIPTSLPIQQQCMKKLVRKECMREFFFKYADRMKQLENSPQA